MRDPDPENLRQSEHPAMVEVVGQGGVFAADATLKDNGWLRVKHWDSSVVYLPPRRVDAVKRIMTERREGGPDEPHSVRYIAEDDYLALAKEWTADDTDADAEAAEPVVGDD
ncbi:hypothetical protein EGH21_05360 [Halomicroarcula sp. F13]|uniref:Uncharacterized protein n=1 Tax=Haloarcula rubra TaxID=2487747 RepID=A0AAW4PPH0_9EURY|nr:hypothetical protein [Halomicroarcula rubra]MBX0322455.1 hypothetical protein [Halomicroarcula rubra]